ncbi:MAG: exonuclease domain-containing protein [Marmoricola sp.]
MSGYAVVDVQTTGLEPSMRHRVVEIAIVTLSDSGQPVDYWCTLVNPQRDVGETGLHGVSARDVMKAPIFDDLVPLVLRSVRGRTLVAHNLDFELRFLESELRNSGVPLAMPLQVGVPTMEWFGLLSTRRRRRLVDCCEEVGIELGRRYSSAHQAAAVAELLRRCIEVSSGEPPWGDALAWSREYPWPTMTSTEAECVLMARDDAEQRNEASWLDGIIAKMPTGAEAKVDSYLDVLEMALLDRYLSAHEIDSLLAVASNLGLDRAAVETLHQDYLVAMAKVAWQDGVVTGDERADLMHVASTLGLGEERVDEALAAARSANSDAEVATGFALSTGDAVCFTGSMSCPRELLERDATGHGLVVGGLTKRTKLLVAADPDSLSGKAKKARAYGAVIVNEAGFRSLLGQMKKASGL